MIVEKAELVILTGYVQRAAQVRWLRRNGWKFVINALGNPIVAVAEFNRHMVGGKQAVASQEPNYEGINDSIKSKP